MTSATTTVLTTSKSSGYGMGASKEGGETLLHVRGLKMHFPITKGIVFQTSGGRHQGGGRHQLSICTVVRRWAW